MQNNREATGLQASGKPKALLPLAQPVAKQGFYFCESEHTYQLASVLYS